MLQKPRLFIPALAVVALFLMGLASFLAPASSFGSTGQPNMILIITDDLDVEALKYMPKLQQGLINAGASFSQFFASHPLCCPSRASMLRGQYEHNHQVRGNRPPRGGFERFRDLGLENSTVATWLQASGYNTIYLGKYMNSYDAQNPNTYVPPGWGEWYAIAGKGDDRAFGYELNENGTIMTYGAQPDDYLTDVLSRKAVDFIKRNRSTGKPFFMLMAPHAPHGPAVPAPRHAGLFSELVAPRTPSFNEADVSDKPAIIRDLPLLTDADVAIIDDQYRMRLQSLQAVDDMVQNLIATLQETGQLGTTYIFFTSDNGFHLGQHRLKAGKNHPYEEDIALPLIARGPGVAQGKVVDQLAGNVDLAPTIAELARVTAPEFVDGRSLVSLFGSSKATSWRRAFLLEKNQHTDPGFAGLRTDDYAYIEYATGERELYDLRRDPYQLQNSYSTADPDLIRSLSSQLQALSACQADGCRSAEQ